MTDQHESSTALGNYLEENFLVPPYYMEYDWDPESGRKSEPWLFWEPHEIETSDNPRKEVRLVESFPNEWFSWTAFKELPEGADKPELFTPSAFFHADEDADEKRLSIVADYRENFSVNDRSIPLSAIQVLKAVRNEAKVELRRRGEEMRRKVMEPLRAIFIPCAVEAYRTITDFRSLSDISSEKVKRWRRTVKSLNRLYSVVIGQGVPLEVIYDSDKTLADIFHSLPTPVVTGLKASLGRYVESSDGENHILSRDDILTRVRPVYFKWEVSSRMIRAALYSQDLDAIIENATILSQPHYEAQKVFEGLVRPEGAKTKNPIKVKEWAKDAFFHFYGSLGAEKAKDKVVGIAEKNDYIFNRRSLERWLSK